MYRCYSCALMEVFCSLFPGDLEYVVTRDNAQEYSLRIYHGSAQNNYLSRRSAASSRSSKALTLIAGERIIPYRVGGVSQHHILKAHRADKAGCHVGDVYEVDGLAVSSLLPDFLHGPFDSQSGRTET